MTNAGTDLAQAFEEKSRREAIFNFKVACVLGMVLVPAFSFLDFAVYEEQAVEFLRLRLGCSAAIGVFLAVMLSKFGLRHYRFFGVTLVLLPATAIAFMVYRTTGAESPYYAGLNLVLLVVGFVLRWTFKESLIAVGLVVVEYLLACYLNGNSGVGGFRLSNLFFLVATGVIVVTGNYFFSKLRFREFKSGYELDLTRQKLEASNSDLSRTLSELQYAQEQLVQMEKEKLLNQLSANIVHDVGNLMAPVSNYLFKLKSMGSQLPADRQVPYADTLAKIERPMAAARGVLATLQRYAHATPQMTHECPVAGLIDEAVSLVRGTADEVPVTIKCNVDRQFVVLGQPLDLTMAFKNLLDNAIHAVQAKKFEDEVPAIWVESRLEEKRGILIVRDNGVGIQPEDVDRLFTPYFSTRKEAGNGTGLGLVGCKATIEKVGGSISVRSEAGKFTEFTLELPRHKIKTHN